jgi:hypothetical protein
MLVNTTAAPSTVSDTGGGQAIAAAVNVKNTIPSWQAVFSLLIADGSP